MTMIRLLLAREKADVAGKKLWDAHLSVSFVQCCLLFNTITQFIGDRGCCYPFEDHVEHARYHDARNHSLVGK
jgi:hypothetical protein